MSYEIMYAKKFIKLSNGIVLPIVMSGSNNCTMFVGGQEIYERHWWAFAGLIGKTEDELMAWAKNYASEHNSSYEMFKEHSKWVTGNDLEKWMKNCISKASFIEDILPANPGVSFTTSLTLYDSSKKYGEKGYCTEDLKKFIHTTEEIEEWLVEAEKKKEEWKGKGEVYFNFEFSTIKPLKVNSIPKNLSGPVICSPKKGHYITEYTDHGYSYCPDIKQAFVFESEEAFKASGLTKWLHGYHLASADKIDKPRKEKNFGIIVMDLTYRGSYVRKLSAHSLSFTRHPDEAKKFESEKEALRYIEINLKDRFPGINDFRVKYLKED